MDEINNRVMLVDEKYRIVLGVLQITKTISEIDPQINVESISQISNTPVLTYNFDEYIEKFESAQKYTTLKSPSSYIFTKDFEFKVRPRIITHIEDGDPNQLLLSKTYTCLVKYFDPDNINFFNEFEYIKFKDRYRFLNIRKNLILDKDTKESRIKFKSDFPGVCKFRSKDNKFICTMSVLQCRFIQEVIE